MAVEVRSDDLEVRIWFEAFNWYRGEWSLLQEQLTKYRKNRQEWLRSSNDIEESVAGKSTPTSCSLLYTSEDCTPSLLQKTLSSRFMISLCFPKLSRNSPQTFSSNCQDSPCWYLARFHCPSKTQTTQNR
jgi:hypothetical protein